MSENLISGFGRSSYYDCACTINIEKHIDDKSIISSPFTIIYDHSKQFSVIELGIKGKSFDES